MGLRLNSQPRLILHLRSILNFKFSLLYFGNCSSLNSDIWNSVPDRTDRTCSL